MSGRALIAGIGNVFFGDDRFGVEVVAHLARRPLPAGVEVLDTGIRGLDLAFRLLEGYERVVLVDAVCRGAAPGTLVLLDPDLDAEWPGGETLDTHAMVPARALRMAREMGARWNTLRLVGCEPACLEGDALSPPVAARVADAADLALREAIADPGAATLTAPHAQEQTRHA